MTVPTRAEIDVLVRQAISDDPGFRERLLADPRGTLSELIGTQVPEFVSVTVHEESLTDVHLVLPTLTDEVSEDDLELVAGGGVCWFDYCQE